ncbi:MFS transporter [Rhizobium brockwellii]|uniref:MFS transporter n=1 Tax=Rhizobium TaxID=379 RepID=UPI002961F6D2|nr:MFS transporter [Rhizobium ruizarguesonis]
MRTDRSKDTIERLEPRHRAVILVTSLGGAMVYFDFVLLAFYSPMLAKIFFPSSGSLTSVTYQVWVLFAAGYVVRPLGGIVLANFGDLFGRRRIYMFSIILMTFSTFGIALAPTYESVGVIAPISLVAFRFMQGIAIGGEVPGGWTFISEHVPRSRLGLACGLLCSGLSFGILTGCVSALALEMLAGPQWAEAYGWRLCFLLGGLFGLLAIRARKYLQETPVFREMIAKRQLVPVLPLGIVLREFRPSLVICMLLTWVLSAGIVTTTLLSVNFLRLFVGYSASEALFATAISTLGLTISTAPVGALVDRYGTGPVFIVGGICLSVSALLFYKLVDVSLLHLYVLSAVLGSFVGVVGAVPYVMVRSFPSQVRFTGVSFAYNCAYAIFGGLTPFAVDGLVQIDRMAYAYYLCFLSCLSIAIGYYIWRKGLADER